MTRLTSFRHIMYSDLYGSILMSGILQDDGGRDERVNEVTLAENEVVFDQGHKL